MKFCFGIWSDFKDDAEKQLDRAVDGGNDNSTVVGICDTSTNIAQRKRKKKSFGKDVEENNDGEASDDSGENESMCHLTYIVWQYEWQTLDKMQSPECAKYLKQFILPKTYSPKLIC